MLVQKCPVPRFVPAQPPRADALAHSVENRKPYERPRPPGQKPDRHCQVHRQLGDLRIDMQHVQADREIEHPGEKLHENRHRIQVIRPDQGGCPQIPPAGAEKCRIAFAEGLAPSPRRPFDFLVQPQRLGVGGIIVVGRLVGVADQQIHQQDGGQEQQQDFCAPRQRTGKPRKKRRRVLFGYERFAVGL